ncbi:putative ribonuclease H protein [Cardamine amara subsp. amara]|uniref:Ribonuclease H protein n=1 Tax=Cardamine amara subsp. amara TaxID=228776 RepID=A0ABD1BFZ0_CARAN
MLKIDLKKAFDSIEWSFILDILKATNFPPKYIQWISQCIRSTRFSIQVNGELCGYFRGKKGLRQGDPLSPYLFVLGMDIFSRLLDARFQDGQIGYHPKATNPNVSHLIFADDVMVFYDGEISSLQAIVKLLDYFSTISGLILNINKTELFLAGSTDAFRNLQSSKFGFPLGELPVRYLGLPLLPHTLSRSDCEPLVMRIRSRLHSWHIKHLSYAGRLQLLSSVIQNIIAYWCAAFILPQKCIKDLEKLCRRFLWSGSGETPKQAKVSWSQVCSPKSEGGLGLKDLKLWNRTYGLKLIWQLFSASGSLWVAWCRRYRLRRKSFWALPQVSQGSSTWKQLLKLRDIAKPFLSCIVGNGEKASFWYDSWTPFGELYSFLSSEEHRIMGLPLDSYVKQARTANGWIFRGARSPNAELLLNHLTTIDLVQGKEDHYLWTNSKGTPKDRFKFTDTWDKIGTRRLDVPWHNQVWFSGSVPKHSFIMWLGCLDKLPTLSRLRNWGIREDDTCPLCEISRETRNHLLLRCPYSYDLWRWCLNKLNYSFMGFSNWLELLTWLRSPTQEDSMHALRLIAAQHVVYSLWRERNTRIFTSSRTPVHGLFSGIDRGIRNTCSARRHLPNFQYSLQLWFRGSSL